MLGDHMSDKPDDIPEEFKAWAKLGDIAGESDDLSNAILEDLKPRIDAGTISVELENQKYFDLLESKYPIGLNRIDWRGVRDHRVVDVFPAEGTEMSGAEQERELAEYRDVLVDWFNSYGIDSQDPVIWIGTSGNLSLHMTIGSLLECYPIIFTYAQHSYVLPVTGEWCLNYTMEGQLFLGKSENAVVQGCVDLDSPSAE